MEHYAETPDGRLLIANGLDPVRVWDGLTPQTERAGLAAPTAAPALAGSGVGAIVGTYYARLRYVDRHGNVSDTSPVSAETTLAGGATGTVTDATNAAPIVITTAAAHGLTTGATVKIEGVGGNTEANNLWVVTVLSSTTFSLDESSGGADYTGSGTFTSGVSTVTYTSLQAPSDPKVTRRQVLRTTDGQADTYYVDLDTDDLSSASLQSAKADSELSAQEAVPILDERGGLFADRHGLPPDHKAVPAHHKSRLFLAVERVVTGGMIQVALGGTTVTGIDTGWTEALAGRYLYVDGATASYEIDSVDAAAQTLTLAEAYAGATDLFASYAVRPAPAERRLVYFSEAGLPESWPAVNGLEVQEDGDEITGLMPKSSFLYILEERHVYRLTFQTDPGVEGDGAIFLAADRGCVNQRCWAVVGSRAYLLDEEGVWAFGGDEGEEAVSEPVADLFTPAGTDLPLRVHWRARENFHCLHFAPEQVIRWFVSLDGSWWPRHALCLNYRDGRWWVEEFRHPIGGAAAGRLGGIPQQFLGAASRRVLAYGAGPLDGPDPSAGTLRGTATAGTLLGLTDAAGVFGSALVGAPLALTAGRGKGQVRTVAAVSGTTLTVDRPWTVTPDATTGYQVGGMPWAWRSSWFRFAPAEQTEARRVEVVFQPQRRAGTFDLRLRRDFAPAPFAWDRALSSEQGNGVESASGEPDLVCDLTKATGVVQKQVPGHRENHSDGRRWTQIELRGVSGRESPRVYEVSYDGVLPPGGG